MVTAPLKKGWLLINHCTDDKAREWISTPNNMEGTERSILKDHLCSFLTRLVGECWQGNNSLWQLECSKQLDFNLSEKGSVCIHSVCSSYSVLWEESRGWDVNFALRIWSLIGETISTQNRWLENNNVTLRELSRQLLVKWCDRSTEHLLLVKDLIYSNYLHWESWLRY